MGLAAGIAPGPLLVLVVSETLKGNRVNGILIALSPLITDLPIILVSVYLLSLFSNTNLILGILSVFGGIFLLYLGIQNFRVHDKERPPEVNYRNTIKSGVITNLLSPHPYIFWLTVGAPTVFKSVKVDSASPFFFITGFYIFLIGSKVAVALISDKAKGFMRSSAYKSTIKIMGLMLLVFAVLMIYSGINML